MNRSPRAADLLLPEVSAGTWFWGPASGNMPPPSRRLDPERTAMRKAAIPLVGLMFLAASWGASPAQSATTWKKVGNVFANFAQPGLERTSDGVLHAVWVHEANNTFTLEHTPISAGGAVGSTILVQSNWVQMAAVPDLVPDPQSGGLRAFWGGTRTTNF